MLDEISEPPALAPAFVEVGRRQPLLVGTPQRRPLAIEHREPRGVAIAPFVYDGLAENALEAEAQTFGGAAPRHIQAVALPFVAAIAELVENAAHHQEHRLRRQARALQQRREVQIADFDDAHCRLHPHESSAPAPGRLLASNGEKFRLPTSMTPTAGSIRMKAATPTADPVAPSTIACSN